MCLQFQMTLLDDNVKKILSSCGASDENEIVFNRLPAIPSYRPMAISATHTLLLSVFQRVNFGSLHI